MKLVILTQRDPIFIDKFLHGIHYKVFDDVVIYDSPNFGAGKLLGFRKFIKMFGLGAALHEILKLLFQKKLKQKINRKSWADICDELKDEDLTNSVLLSVSAPHKIPKSILDNTKYALNVHCGKLPHYAGMMPIFWQYSKKQRSICITLHTMEEEIDRGKVLKEIHIPISGELLKDMKKAKQVSAVIFNSFIMSEHEIYNASTTTFNTYPSDEMIEKVLRK